MQKNRVLTFVFILMLCISFSGCAGLQRKFTRKKKKEEKEAPVITTYDYSKERRLDELYKKRYLFWQSWHLELIDRLESNYKKRISCHDHALENLMEMKKYLKSPKDKELEVFIKEIKSTQSTLKEKRLSKGAINKLRNVLEKTKRQIQKKFSYSDVKEFLELREVE